MQTNDVTGLQYLVPPNESPYPYYPGMAQTDLSPFQINKYTNLLYNLQIGSNLPELTPHPSCFSNNSTSDEADEQQLSIINERKQRRMISNRESARRSRMRKQRHLDELWSQVVWLRNENHQLINKLNHVTESHDLVLQENVQLKEEASELRQMVTDMQLSSPYSTLRDLGEVTNVVYLGDKTPN
ncbi:basic leucine zipper 43-like [Amaranthus tricolor]|uniref:basic leucine zipper 43-like n=1 Tax=Amaranthus tricolor TaxID=29722 RepID=UPI002582D31B|nr:basic leucine zipper 43-like [Amaranthus tricolor]